MHKTKTLNLADIISLKKDILWGKYYYALFEDGKLLDSLVFSHPHYNKNIIEIHKIEKQNQGFLLEFTQEYAKKKKIRYFVRELNESTQTADIEFMQSCGFIRYNRNYCFEYKSKDFDIRANTEPSVFCRPAELDDIEQLLDLDINSQILEYRDYLHKERRYFKNNIENIYVFTDPSKLKHIHAFAYKKHPDLDAVYELVLHPRHNHILLPCINAFAEEFILFEKNSEEFKFIINENQKEKLEEIQAKFTLLWSCQLLLLEGRPRSKSKQLIGDFALAQTSTIGAKATTQVTN